MIKTPAYQDSMRKINESMYNTQNMYTASPEDVYKEPLAPNEEYSFSESFKAGFRQYSPIPSIARMIENTEFDDDPTYDPLRDKQIPEGYEWRFLNSSSENETSVRLQRLEADLKDLDIVENSNLFATGLGGLISPLIVAPVGTFKTLTSQSFLKRFLGSTALTMAL